MTQPDIDIKVRFRTSVEGGRKTSLKSKIALEDACYACPLLVDKKAYDCRLLIGKNELERGKEYEVSLQFLDKESALPHMSVGKHITLWEGKEVADGQVIRIYK